jgi:two-component system, sensor histidine kinase
VRIEQIVANLLDNALKSTTSDDSLEISLTQPQDAAIISVRDTGAGIETSRVDRLFELFSQGTSGPTDAGLGIGLWLAKTLTEMHGGQFEPRAMDSAKVPSWSCGYHVCRAMLEEQPNRSKRVLIVEDDPEQRELWLIALSELDAAIWAAKDGAEALKMASEHRFDVCILDLNLPDVSGYDLLEQLLALHSERRPVTIALTGFGRPEDEARVKAAGFDHHIVKPADISLIQQIIAQSKRIR